MNIMMYICAVFTSIYKFVRTTTKLFIWNYTRAYTANKFAVKSYVCIYLYIYLENNIYPYMRKWFGIAARRRMRAACNRVTFRKTFCTTGTVRAWCVRRKHASKIQQPLCDHIARADLSFSGVYLVRVCTDVGKILQKYLRNKNPN